MARLARAQNGDCPYFSFLPTRWEGEGMRLDQNRAFTASRAERGLPGMMLVLLCAVRK
jgi:hypothetical protein